MIGRRLETKEHLDWLIQVRVTRCWSVTDTFSFFFVNLALLSRVFHIINVLGRRQRQFEKIHDIA
jgi:hypothetical protein